MTPNGQLTKEQLTEQLSLAELERKIAEANLGTTKAHNEKKTILAGNTQNAAQATTPPPNAANKPEQQHKSEEQIQADAAKAQNDTVQAYVNAFKSSEVTPPTGKITSKGDFIETRILARETLAATLKKFLDEWAKAGELTTSPKWQKLEEQKQAAKVAADAAAEKQKEADDLKVKAKKQREEENKVAQEIASEQNKADTSKTADELKSAAANKQQEADNLKVEASIAALVAKKLVITLVLIQPADVAALELCTQMLAQLTVFQKDYQNAYDAATEFLNPKETALAETSLLSPAAAVPGIVATGIVSSVAKLVALFRTTTDITNADIPVDSALLTATLVQVAQAKNKEDNVIMWRVFAPSLFPVDMLQEAISQDSSGRPVLPLPLISSLENLYQEAQQVTNKLEQQISDKQLEQSSLPAEDDSGKADLQRSITDYNYHLDKLRALGNSYSQLSIGFAAATSPLVSLIRSSQLLNKLRELNTYTVMLTATSKGSTRTKSWLWNSDHISFSAGTELSYLVFGIDGQIIYAGSTCEYTPYTKSQDIPGKLIKH